MSINKRIFVVLLCCLIQLFLCRNIDSERLADQQHSAIGRHLHRKRSLMHDPRYLGFQFEIEPESTSITEKSFAIFHCKYRINLGVSKSSEESTNPEVRIEWRKDGTIVDHIRSAGRIRTLINGSLTIENASVADEGNYQCAVIVNSYQFVSSVPWIFLSRRVSLHSLLFDRFEYQPIDQTVAQKQTAAFRCVVNSKPPVTIEWYKDNIRLKLKDILESTNLLPISQTLVLSNVTKEDAGTYKCAARNGLKSRVSQTALLQINEEFIDAGSLSVVLEPRSQVFKAGESFILECLVNGIPTPKVHWLHNSLPIVADSRKYFVGAQNSSLLIERAEQSDSGTYMCRTENGKDYLDLPAIITIRTPPRIVTAPRDEATQETLDVEFECVADGVPKPRITWYKNGEVIVPSEYFVIASNRLKVFGLVKDDQGVYQCFAENDMGSAQAGAQLLVDAAASHMALTAVGAIEERQVPPQPLGLQSIDVTSRSVSLKWDRPVHFTDISLYHIFYREEDSTSEKLANSTTNTVVISSLKSGTKYVIRVAGENGAGLGKASESIRISTKREETVPGKVRNLRAEVIGSETIKVDWDPPSLEVGSEASRYRLFYLKANSSDDEHETRVLLVKTSYTLHSMEKFAKYLIRVEAEGVNGVGPTSDQLEVTTFSDVPSGPPKNIRLEAPAPKVIRVRWSPPDVEHRNGVITDYKIRYKTKRKGSKGNVVVVEGDPSVYVIEGVEPGSHYTVRIAAMTTNGTGIFSDWFGIDTPMEEREETQIAGAPSELRVHAGHDSVQVSWLPPREDSVMIRGYLIGWGVNIPDVEKTSVDATVRHYTIKGLKPSREYVISLRAFNNVGNGFPIYETVKTTANGYGSSSFQQPGKNGDVSDLSDFRKSHISTPVGVIAEPVSSSSIRVSWIDPNDGFNQYYTVRYSSSSDNNGQIRQFNTSETEFVIDGLKPNTQYEFAVKLVESSQWSMSAVNKTFSSPPSSAPRDLSIFAAHDDPNTVTLSWQPPKYANGEIEEYIVLYSDKLDLSDKDWVMDSVKGDRLSMTIRNLLPMASYYFKIQARNVKGYGPLSPVVTYSSLRFGGDIPPRTKFGENVHRSNEAFYAHLGQLLTSNFIYVLIGIISVVLLFLIVVLTVVCVQRKNFSSGSNSKKSPSHHSSDYMEGRKYSTLTLSRLNNNQQQHPDLWIQQQQNGGRFAALNNGREISVDFMETPQNLVQDMKRFGGGVQQTSTESPPPRYQTLQGGVMSQSFHSQGSIYGCLPLVRYNRHRKSLPPRISTSVLSSSISPSPAHCSPNHSVTNAQKVPHHCCGVMPFCTNKAFSERGSNEMEERKPNSSLYEQFSPHGTFLTNGNKVERLMVSKPSPRTVDSSFSGVGIPTIPLISSAKRCLTAKLKQPVPSFEKDVRVKTVNFSPEVSVNEDDFCWQRQPLYEHYSSKDVDDGGTLSRSYHQSSTSLEIARQKNPQILYTGVNRQPIAKVDFAHSDHGSHAGSSTMLQMNNTPPSSLNGGGNDYNQTVRSMNPLKSFAQMGGAPPPMTGSPYLSGSSAANGDQRKTAHIVRPVVFASPTFRNSCANGKPAGVVIGQKMSLPGKLPIGRATAQPRVNVSERIYSPYSTVRVTQEGVSCKSEVDSSRPDSSDRFDECDEMKPLKPAQSSEDINEIENNEFDHMIDTLQQLQQEFTER